MTIVKPRSWGRTLFSLVLVALAAGPIFWEGLMIAIFLSRAFGAGQDSYSPGDIPFSFLIAILAVIFSLPIALPAAIFNALIQAYLIKREQTIWAWAPISGMIAGLTGLCVVQLSDLSFSTNVMIDDPLGMGVFIFVSALMGILYRHLAFRREILKVDFNAL